MKKKNFFGILTVMLISAAAVSFYSCKDDTPPTPPDEKVDPSTIAAANLVAYMPFDDSAVDSKGGRTVTTVGTPTYVTGRRGKAYQGADGVGFKYALPANDRIPKAKALTIAMWLKTPAAAPNNEAGLFAMNGTADPWKAPGSFTIHLQDYEINGTLSTAWVGMKCFTWDTATEWKGQWGDTTGAEDKELMPANQWFHWVWMYDNTDSAYKIYVNGTEVWSNVRYAGPVPTEGDQPLLGDLNLPTDITTFYVGAWWGLLENDPSAESWSSYFVGNMDEVRIYDKGLTATEVKALFDAEVDNMNE